MTQRLDIELTCNELTVMEAGSERDSMLHRAHYLCVTSTLRALGEPVTLPGQVGQGVVPIPAQS